MNDPTETIQNLLAKAQATSFPEEAEAFVAKAQALMVRFSIDEAALRMGTPSTETPGVAVERIPAPHAKAKASLLNAIAKSNGAHVVFYGNVHDGNQDVHLVGYSADRARTLDLFATLSVVMTREMVEARKHSHLHGKTFAHSFIHGFANRIGQRLREAKRDAETEASSEGVSTALVVQSRDSQVNAAMKERFPRLHTVTSQVSSRDAWHSGRAAANRANLSSSVGAGSRRALS